MTEKFTPSGSNILVRMADTDKVTPQGIHLPDKASVEQYSEAVVVAVGPGSRLNDGSYAKPWVSVGDTVLIPPGRVMPIEVNGEKLHVLDEYGVMGVMERGEE